MPRRDSLLRRFLALEGADKALALEAAALLAYACVTVRWSSGRSLGRRLRRETAEGTEATGSHRGTETQGRAACAGQSNAASASLGLRLIRLPPPPPFPPAARLIGMIGRVARIHPLRPLCLEQALAGKWLLARHGHASTLVIGVRRPIFEAHAWLELTDDGSPEGLPQITAEAPPCAAPLTSAAGHHAIWRA